MTHVLRIDTSARRNGSISRHLTDEIIAKMQADTVTTRDLGNGLPQINEAWVEANMTPADQRSPAQTQALALSDELIAELQAADTLVIGLPLYNFGIPGALKAWIDQVARAGITFEYSEYGPKGLLDGKRAIIAFASGGVEAGSDVDFATTYMRHVLAFIGITQVDFVAAEQVAIDADGALETARAQVERLAA